MPRLFVVLMFALLPASIAFGQEGTGAVYVDGGVTLVNSAGVTASSLHSYLMVPGGTTVGWKAAVGAFVGPLVSIEGDLLRTGTMSARESDHSGYTSLEERQETLIGGILRIHTTPRKRADVEATFGVHLVRTNAWSTDLRSPSGLPPSSTQGQRQNMPSITTGSISLGAAVRIGGPRFAVVPAFRWDHRSSPDFYDHWPNGGWGRTLTASVSLRATL